MSPDLYVTISSPGLTRAAAERIADAQWPAEALWVHPGGNRLVTRLLRLGAHAGSLSLGAHDILDDQADWNSKTWLFNPAQLNRFVVTLRRLYELLPDRLSLLAAWVGEDPTEVRDVTRDELLTALAENRLGNRVLYRVAAAS